MSLGDGSGYALVFKANPYHDRLGRFSTANSAGFISLWGKQSLMDSPAADTREYVDIEKAAPVQVSQFEGRHRAALKALGSGELQSVKGYTLTDYDEINRALRGLGDPEDAADYEVSISTLKSVVTRTEVGENLKTYRGVSGGHAMDLHKAWLDRTLDGSVYEDRAFMSTSVSVTRARGFIDYNAGALFRINVKAEQKGLYVESVTEVTGERELILPPKTKLVIKSSRMDGRTLLIDADAIPGA